MKKYKKFSKESIADIIALTPMQEGMLFFYLKEPEKNHYFEQLSLKISGKIDIDCFEQAWNFVIETNEMLRAVFRWEKLKNPTQVVLRDHTITLRYHDFFTKGIGEKRGRIEEIKTKDRKEKFDLREVPFRVTLCKVEEDKYEMIISNHHILYDGWSNGIILREFFNAYNDLTAGKVPFIPVKTSFKEFVKWNQQQDTKKQEIFWREYLRGVDRDNRIGIPIKRGNIKDSENGNSKEESGVRNYRYRMTFNGEKGDHVRDFVKAHKITAAALLYGAWGILLQKYTNSSDVIFGTTVSGRTAKIKGIEKMVGLFINTIPLRVRTSTSTSSGTGCSNGGRQSLVRMLACLSDTLQTREVYENTPLVKINEYLQCSDNEELFDSIVVIENYPLDSHQLQKSGPLRIDSFSMVEDTHYDLTVVIQVFDSIDINFIYQDLLFDDVVIRRLGTHFTCIIREILENPWKDISEIDILSPEEKQQILEDFNRTAVDYPRDKTIHQLFEEQAKKTPDNIAVVATSAGYRSHSKGETLGGCPAPEHQGRGGGDLQYISYKELNEKSNQLARVLRAEGIGKKGITGIMIHRSVEMVYGILAILKIGSAYLPVDPDYPQERIRYMLMDSSSNLLLTGKVQISCLEEGPKVIDIENEEIYKGDMSNLPTTGKSENPAYVIYTSGTTGRPKGVLVEHINVVRLVKNTNYIAFYPQDRLLQTGALEFDASTFEIWGMLLNGAGLVLVSKETILNHVLLKNVIRKCNISIMWLTSSLFNQVSDIELFEGLTHLLVGGDVLSPPHINRVRKRFPYLKVINGYGPTENTTFSTTYLIDDHDPDRESHKKFPIGKPIANSTAYIVDKNNHLMPVGVPGELIVGGDGVSRGYLNNPALTAEKFDRDFQDYQDYQDKKAPAARGSSKEKEKGTGKYSFTSLPLYPSTSLYRTGDLARWQPDGNIEFLGRLDHQVKVRGFRVELEEIQNLLLKHEDVEEAVVISRNGETGENYLCAYVVGSLETSQISGLRDYLSGKLPGYMIPSYFVALERLPLTPNGKLDRKALPDVETISEREYCAPRNKREELLVEIWSEVLTLDKDQIGIDDNFFELGGHSLKIAGLIGRIHKVFNIEIPFSVLFETLTIRGIYQYMREAEERMHQAIPLVEEKEYYPLAPAQKRFYVFHQLNPGDISYNMSETILLEGQLSRGKFEATFRQSLDRHEILRTSFHRVEGEAVQRIHQEVGFNIEYYDLEIINGEGKETIIRDFIRPFDLSQPPLWRVGLVKTAPDKHLFMFDMHHIISDGTSIGLFIRDFLSIYKEKALHPLKVRYRDYALWENKKKERNRGMSQVIPGQWELEEEVLNLPTDYMRPVVPTYEGESIVFDEEADVTEALYGLSEKQDVTLYMLLLAICNILFSKLSGQENIAIGSPIAGRVHVDLDNVMGMFLNIVCLRNKPAGEKRFSEFLIEVKENAVDAFENQDYQYDELIEKAVSVGSTGRNPLFDVMFALQNMEMPGIEIPGLKVTREVSENPSSKFDITLFCEEKDTLVFKLEYRTRLFKEETIQRFIRYFKKVIAEILENPYKKISEIEIISEEEKRQVLYEFNETHTQYPKDKAIHQLFETQAEKTPDNIAIIAQSAERIAFNIEAAPKERYALCPMRYAITYRKLNEKSNELALILRDRGMEPDTIVGIMVERSLDMAIGMLGILKAGGAYLPIDPDYPEQRKQYMLADSSARILITTLNLANQVKVEVKIELNEGTMNLSPHPQPQPEFSKSPLNLSTENPAYIMYTSGSTGEPKGVMVTHRNVVRLVKNTNYAALGEETRILQTGAPVFDATTFEIWGALLNGGQLVLAYKEVILDAHQLARALEEYRINTLWLSSPLFNQLMQQNIELFSPLRYLLVGGDVLSPAHINRVKHRFPKLKIINGYGPTENTTFSTTYLIEEAFEQNIPIGSPINNSTAYIVDKNNHFQPVGIWGELCVGGDGVSSGYINSPELTAEKFDKDFQVYHDDQDIFIKTKVLRGVQGGGFSKEHSWAPETRLYRTGDLARWLPDGNIEFSGRIDQQVKVRGFRVELGEIEDCLLKWDEIEEAVVIAVPDEKGDKYLCAYVVPHTADTLQVSELREYLAVELPEYMVPTYFVLLEKIPLNPNGKVDRKALPEPEVIVEAEYVAPRSELEEKLVEIWSEVLGIEKDLIGIDANFFEMGGNSLKVTILTAKIWKEFDVEVPLSEIFRTPFIRELSKYIKEADREKFIAMDPVEKKDYYVVSSPQKRLYILQQMESDNISYNVSDAVYLEGNVDIDRIQKVFKQLIQRHESLRTSFFMMNGEPVLKIHHHVDFEIEHWDSIHGHEAAGNGEWGGEPGESSINNIIDHFARSFDLSHPPLLRVGLLHNPPTTSGHSSQEGNSEEKYFLMVEMHHIITDGVSMGIFIQEFMTLYEGEKLPPLKLQYKDYAKWQNRWLESGEIKKQKEYWMGVFNDGIPVLNLPLDFTRPAVQSFAGHTIRFEIGKKETEALKEIARLEGATMYMVFLAIYNIFLSKLSGQEDIIIGIPIGGRRHADLDQTVGMFVNTLAMRNFPAREKTFLKFLQEVKGRSLAAFENQDYPFEDLKANVFENRDMPRNVLFDVFFQFNNLDDKLANIPEVKIEDLTVRPYNYKGRIAKFDLYLWGKEKESGILFFIEYATRLFRDETVKSFIKYFKQIVSVVVRDNRIKLKDISITHDLLSTKSNILKQDQGDFGF